MRVCQKGLIRDIVGGGEYESLSERVDQGYSGEVSMRDCQKGLIRDIVGGGDDERLSEGVDQGYSWGR